jgi:chemotaxis protein MotB
MSSGHGSGGHGGKPRRRKGHEEEEHENHERWAVSYADMMTVLVGLFIVLYSMSQVDQQKFEELRESLAIGFGNRLPSIIEGSSGAMTGVEAVEVTPDLTADVGTDTVPPVAPAPDTTGLTEEQRNYLAAQRELDHLQEIAEKVTTSLAGQGLGDRVRLRVTERGLVIGLVADDVFFGADAATLTGTALGVIDTISPVLAAATEEISIEGHANTVPSVRYPTNWELSSARATEVLRRMTDVGGVPGWRISAVGFGDQRPLDEPGIDPLESNRRVDVVILSGQPEEVRSLLPQVAAQRQANGG